MRTDTIIRQEGAISEPFDYTKWQGDLFEGVASDEFEQKAMEYWVNERERQGNLQKDIAV